MTKKINYQDGDTHLQAYCAYRSDLKKPSPGILVAHDWSGRTEFTCERAEQLADLGYVGFALDMYGEGKIGQTKEEKMALMTPFIQSRSQLLQRILMAYHTLCALPQVNASKVAAIGFCFGGLCVLDLARAGTPLNGVVSFHGALTPKDTSPHAISAKILALHGYADPMVNSDQMLQFCDEMTAANANWELNVYGNTMHAFTNPQANDPDFGTVYDAQADTRSWSAMQRFFTELFHN